MSTFWSLWIIGLTVISLLLITWVLFANRKVALRDDEDPENRTTGHVYDGIEEYDNPLPRWWFKLFVGTLIFTVLYLILFPGLGAFKGLLGWSSVGKLESEQKKAQQNYQAVFGSYAKMPIEELADDASARKMGMRLFANNCAVCHGSDGGGLFGYPNLTDKDWLYGGTPEAIKASITNGRAGAMPAWGSILDDKNLAAVSEYVLNLSDSSANKVLAESGQPVYMQYCAACHGADGSGNTALGAPNLTDSIWLYGGEREEITYSIRAGRANVMPAQKDKIRKEKIHLLTAYVYGLSMDEE